MKTELTESFVLNFLIVSLCVQSAFATKLSRFLCWSVLISPIRKSRSTLWICDLSVFSALLVQTVLNFLLGLPYSFIVICELKHQSEEPYLLTMLRLPWCPGEPKGMLRELGGGHLSQHIIWLTSTRSLAFPAFHLQWYKQSWP